MSSYRKWILDEPHVVEQYARGSSAFREPTAIRQPTRSGRKRLLYPRWISGPDLTRQMRLKRQVFHKNIVHVLQVEEFEDSGYLLEISELVPRVVVDVCAKSFAAFDETALAAVLGQVLRGLTYMAAAGLGQTNFSTKKVLMDYNGNVKIGGAAYSEQWQNHPTMLIPLVHQLMYPWDYDSRIKFHPDKWSKNSAAIEFLQALSQPDTTLNDLLATRLLMLPWKRADIRDLAVLETWNLSETTPR